MKITQYIALAALLSATVGCELIKSEREIEDEKNAANIEINFRADVEHAATKATSEMASDTKTRVIAFATAAEVTTATHLFNQIRTCDLSGNLTGEKITLDRGTYDFYGVSLNTTTDPINFTNGIATVTNGIDYLWDKQNKVITAGDKSVSFGFKHKAVMVKIALAGDGITFANTAIKIKASDDAGATMALATGVIAPATATKTDFASMSIAADNKTGSYAMIPLVAGQSLTVEITADVTIDGVLSSGRIYEATIPQQAAGFLAGKLYSYVATITANQEVALSGATIGDWENGNGVGGEEINPNERPAI